MGGKHVESSAGNQKKSRKKKSVLLKCTMNNTRKINVLKWSSKKNVPLLEREGKQEDIFDEKTWTASESLQSPNKNAKWEGSA